MVQESNASIKWYENNNMKTGNSFHVTVTAVTVTAVVVSQSVQNVSQIVVLHVENDLCGLAC